jgi:hypothetical protein
VTPSLSLPCDSISRSLPLSLHQHSPPLPLQAARSGKARLRATTCTSPPLTPPPTPPRPHATTNTSSSPGAQIRQGGRPPHSDPASRRPPVTGSGEEEAGRARFLSPSGRLLSAAAWVPLSPPLSLYLSLAGCQIWWWCPRWPLPQLRAAGGGGRGSADPRWRQA